MNKYLLSFGTDLQRIFTKFGKDMPKALGVTILIAVVAIVIGIILGGIISISRVAPKDKLVIKIWDKINSIYVWFFRGTPLVVQLLIFNFIIFAKVPFVTPIVLGCIVMGLNSGAYVSEMFRSGIKSVDAGQLEAARAVGLSYWKGMGKVVMPQAVKNIVPTLGNEFIVLIKDTSILSFLAVTDITSVFKKAAASDYAIIPAYITLAGIYLILVTVAAKIVRKIEDKLKKNERGK